MQTWNNHQILLTIRIIFWRAITKLLNILLFSSVIFSAVSLENNPVNKSFSVQFCIFSFYWIHWKSILQGRASEHQLHLYYSPQHQVSSKVLIKFSNFFWTSCLYLFFSPNSAAAWSSQADRVYNKEAKSHEKKSNWNFILKMVSWQITYWAFS